MSLPSYFISHGGGPWPWVPEWRRRFANLEAALAHMPEEIGEPPKAVLVVSGHWEEADFAIMASPRPPMVYDYSGFPQATYEIVYPAPGAPEFAAHAATLLRDAGLPARLDEKRGFDHGAFVPLFVMYPRARVPVFQMSLRSGYDPAGHLAAGRALAPLREAGVLIVGSGLSYHNLARFGPAAREPSEAFDKWLGAALADAPSARRRRILAWEEAPFARACHPNADHLAPLFVALGAAEDATATRVYHDEGLFGGVTASSYRFG